MDDSDTQPIPEPLRDILRRNCDVNAFGKTWPNALKSELAMPQQVENAVKFKRQLADAILYETITPEAYESVTGANFETEADLIKWLRELWQAIYGDEEIK